MKKTIIILLILLSSFSTHLLTDISNVQAQQLMPGFRVGPHILTIQAEDYDRGGQCVAYYDKTPGNTGGYYRNDDVDIWWHYPNIYYVGSNSTGEWLNYTIDVPGDGVYRLDLRVATPKSGRQVHIEFDGVNETGSLTAPNTGSWTTWQTLSANVLLSAGRQVMRLVFDYGGMNIDQISVVLVGDMTQVAPPTIEPDGGTFFNLVEVVLSTETVGATIYYTTDGSDPRNSFTKMVYVAPFELSEDTMVRAYAVKAGLTSSEEVIADFTTKEAFGLTIEAEDYDLGGRRVAYYDKTPGNAGGHYRNDDVDIWWYYPNIYYVGSNSTGEWLNYTIDVPGDGEYRLDIRVATPNESRRIHVEFDRMYKTASLTLPNTGGWTTWQTLSTNVELNAGRQVMRLAIDYGGMNIDQITLVHTGGERTWFGNYVVKNEDDLTRLSGYLSVSGNLVIFETSLTGLTDLSSLTSVGGSLIIDYNQDLASLDGLNGLISVGTLSIFGNDNLATLSSLHNLTHVGGYMSIGFNPNLVNLEGLSNLIAVDGGIGIMVNSNLSSLTGLESLTTVGGSLNLDSNTGLESLSGLSSLTSVGGTLLVYEASKISSLTGLNCLTSVGGLGISGNQSLTTLAGIELTTIEGKLDVRDNQKLTNLDVLKSVTAVSGDLFISRNDSLTGLDLDGLEAVGGDFKICENPLLPQKLVEDLRDQVLGLGGIGGNINVGPDCYQ